MNRIRVLFDEGGFYELHGGVSRYFTEVMKRLPALDVGYRLSVQSTCNAYLQQPPFSIPPYPQSVHDFVRCYCGGHYLPGIGHVYRFLARMAPDIFPSGELANLRALPRLLKEDDFDVYHPTHPHLIRNEFRKIVGRKPIVVTVHDLIPELFPGRGSTIRYRPNRAEVLKVAGKIIAVSENTKRDIERIYGIPEKKIRVIYHGYLSGTVGGNVSDDLKAVLAKPYVLFVGKRAGYKNFAWMVRALSPLLKDGLKLVCTGTPFNAAEIEMLGELGVQDVVVQRFLSDDELLYAFSHACAFIYPSRYEGFGIPILDAFSADCPVVLSRSSCFPEIAGDAALYFDEGDDEMLRKSVLAVAAGGKYRMEQIAKGRTRLREFSWTRCAEETANVYREVCGGF